MPIYRLDSAADINLAGNAAVHVSWVVRGSDAQVQVEAVPDGNAPSRAVRPRTNLLIVPPGPDRVTLRVVPIGSPVFATPTEIELQLGVGDQRSAEPVIVRLAPKNISGLASRDLATIEQSARLTVLRSIGSGSEVRMSPLSEGARAAARACLGDRLQARQFASFAVAVDTSGSMLTLLRDGSVEAVLEVLAGIGQAIAVDQPIRCSAVGLDATVLTEAPAAEFARSASAKLDTAVLSSGLRTTVIDGTGPGPVFLITDGLPADVHRRQPDLRLHLIPIVAPGAFALLGDPAVARSVLEPGDEGERLADRLIRRPDELGGFVRSLVADIADSGGME